MKKLAWLAMSAMALSSTSACAPGVTADESGGSGGAKPTTSPSSNTGFDSASSGFGTGTGNMCETHCSSDLHAVLDCNDTVLMTCPMGTGCSTSGGCVDPCQAAKENATTIGCDYYSITPAVIGESRGSCYATMIANTWDTPVTIQADYGGQTINTAPYLYIPSGTGPNLSYQLAPNGQLAPGQLGILFLSQYASGDIFQLPCPVPSALNQPTQLDGTGIGNAFHITTSGPIVMYDVYPWGGSPSFVSSATLLLPTPTWGTNIVSDDAWDAENGQPDTDIVASEDGTTVTIVPSAAIGGGPGVAPAAQNAPTMYTLNRGQVLQVVQQARLAGSTIQSDKPISVWGGATCMNIPSGQVYCDAGHQQLLPVQELGSEYVGVRYPSRGGSDPDQAPYTLVGMVDNTQLAYDPPQSGSPATLNRGQVAVFFTSQVFHVTAQDNDHPFYMAAHMTGSGEGSGIGDPEYVNVIPPQQFLNSYLFVTDPTYRYTSLVFTRQKGKDGLFKDVNLDCAGGPITGWQPVGSGGNYETIRMMIVQGGNGVGGCGNGVHTATSEVPFGLTVWGYDQDVSYGYPAGMSLQPINNVVVPPVPQ